LFGKCHRLLAEVARARLRDRGLPAKSADRLLGSRDEAVERLAGLFDALLGHLPHFRGNFEFRHTLLGHVRLPYPGAFWARVNSAVAPVFATLPQCRTRIAL